MQQEQIPQARPISPPSHPRLASPFQGPYSNLQSATNQEYGQSTAPQGTVQQSAPTTQAALTYPPIRPQAQDSTPSPPRPTGYAPAQNVASPSSPSLAATRPNRMSLGFSSLQPLAYVPATLPSSNQLPIPPPQAPPQAPLTPIQEGTDQSQSQRPSRTSFYQDNRTSVYEPFNPYDDFSPLVPPPSMSYLVNRPSTVNDGPPPALHPAQPNILYETGSGFGTVPDLDDEPYVDASDDSIKAKRSFGDKILSFLAFVVVVIFLPVIIPYKLIRKCLGPRDAYHQIPSSSKPGKFDVALRYVGHVPKSLYQHFLLLRLPNLYFSRVARIFEEADLSLNELKTMALESAEKNLSNKNGKGNHNHVWQWEYGTARGCLPPAYDSLRATWDEFRRESIERVEDLQSHQRLASQVYAFPASYLLSDGADDLLTSSAILTILQIDAAAADPYTRYFALSSLICALVSLLYGCVYIIRFGTMRKPYKVFYWNVWVLLAMPAVYLAWSLLLFICCIMAFVWRTGIEPPAPDPAEPPEALDPTHMHMVLRTIVSFILALGCIYGVLIASTFQRYGTRMDKAWMKRIDGWVEEKRRVKQQIDLEVEREREMLEREADDHEWNEDAYENQQRPRLGRQNTGATGTASVSQPPQLPPFIPSEHQEEDQQRELDLGRGPSTDSKVRNPQRQPPSVPSAVPMRKLPSYRESDEVVPRRAARERNVLDSDAEEDEYGDGGGVGAIAAGARSFTPLTARREATLESQGSRRSAGAREGTEPRGVAIPPAQSILESPTHPLTSSAGASSPKSVSTKAKVSKQAVERNVVPLLTSNTEEGAMSKRGRQATTRSLEGQAHPGEPLSESLRTWGQSSEDLGHRKTMKPEAKSTLPLPPPPPPPRLSTINSGFRHPPPPPPPPLHPL
ncbi:hypothetical protein FA13DRAFT_1083273 [Coprinellus micaceus]|uniref:Uncharacterized protein n=1 Tax=Coprinellus micaceus TaxID=71717 RepID=A0A4Y7TRF8_COPMI|nr:hypothetical protein FA13DRAFT_1083273 [Coprinellus micaceus]